MEKHDAQQYYSLLDNTEDELLGTSKQKFLEDIDSRYVLKFLLIFPKTSKEKKNNQLL